MIKIENFEGSESITELNVLVGEYSFVVRGAMTVRVKIWYTSTSYGGDHYFFTQSHFFHGPNQMDAYVTSAPFSSSEEGALRKAMTTLTSFYPPKGKYDDVDQSQWFVENKNY